jgi:hypothetical protein
MKKNISAGAIEAEVWSKVSQLLNDKEHTLRKMEEHFENKRKELSRPGLAATTIDRRLENIELERRGYLRQNARGVLSDKELDAMLAELDNNYEALQQERERVKNREEQLRNLTKAEEEMRERIEGGYRDIEDSPEGRRKLYQDLHLHVEVDSDKRPHISGMFPLRFTGDGRHTLYYNFRRRSLSNRNTSQNSSPQRPKQRGYVVVSNEVGSFKPTSVKKLPRYCRATYRGCIFG